MRRACERGVRVFDYGRSKRGTGIVRLQEELGFRAGAAALRVSVAQARLAIPQNNPLNPKYRALVAIWRRLPLSAGERARADARPQSGVDMARRRTMGTRSGRTATRRDRRRAARVASRRARAAPTATPDADRADRRRSRRSGWHATWRLAPVLAAGVAVVGILALHWPTAASIVAIWMRSETFTHGFVVVPICLWLVWRQRETCAAIAARAVVAGSAVRAGCRRAVVRDVRRRRARRQAVRARVHGAGGDRHRGRPTRVARAAGLSARVPAVRRARRRNLRPDADRMDRRLHRRRAALRRACRSIARRTIS